jgi:hypothetical protein
MVVTNILEELAASVFKADIPEDGENQVPLKYWYPPNILLGVIILRVTM